MEYLDINGLTFASGLTQHLEREQLESSQCLKKLKENGIVQNTRRGKFMFYDIVVDLPKTLPGCLRSHYFSQSATEH